jgi:hypothetical protein
MLADWNIPGAVVKLAIALLFTAAPLSAQPSARAWTDSSSYQIGRWIAVQTEVTLPAQSVRVVPIVGDTLGAFEVLRSDSLGWRSEGESRIVRWRFILTSFDSGSHVIPPIRFALVDSVAGDRLDVSTSPIPLRMTTVAVDPQGDLKDIKGPLSVPRTLADWTPELLLLTALVVGEAIYLWRRLSRKRREGEQMPLSRVLPPHEIALMALREIEDSRFWQQGRVKEYYSAVTEVVRRFLGARFSIPALEVTSDELLQELAAIPEAERVVRILRSFLTTADLVKFAKYQPTPEEHVRELTWAYEIVRTLIPVSAPVDREEEVHAG